MLLPHALDGLCDKFVVLQGVVSQNDRRQSFAVRKAGFTQHETRFVWVERKANFWIVRQHAGRYPGGRGRPAALKNFWENLSIDRQRKGLSQFRVVERLSIDGEAVILAAQLRHELIARHLREARLLQRRD